mmetsp:Transcript_23117/g.54945  ORF Transcript_23117/g.54945 Transcript_23117/m.54945 type:complete len:111 (-) Transcript_23117:37-369(-)
MMSYRLLLAMCVILASALLSSAASPSPALRSSFAPAAIQPGDLYEIHTPQKTHLGLRNRNDDEDKEQHQGAYKPGITGTWDLVLGKQEKPTTPAAPEHEPCTATRPCTFC